MTRLESYACGSWIAGDGPGTELRDASTGEVVALAGSRGIDPCAMLEHARQVGGPALRALTFHQRATMLRALGKRLMELKEEFYELSYCTGATRPDSWIDIEGGIGTLLTFASKGARELPNATVLLDGDVEGLSKGGTFVGQHIHTSLEGATVREGEPIYTLELEKSTMDVESPAAGVIRQTGLAGTTYKVGEIIGEISEAQVATPVTSMRGSLQRLVQVVPELDAAMQSWASATGAGPFFVFSNIAFVSHEHRGNAALPALSIATGFSGEVLIELVQLHDEAPSAWREITPGCLVPALIVDDLEAALATQLAADRACITRGTYGFGARFAFVESSPSSGQVMQLIEKHFVLTQLTTAMREASTNWDRASLTATLK